MIRRSVVILLALSSMWLFAQKEAENEKEPEVEAVETPQQQEEMKRVQAIREQLEEVAQETKQVRRYMEEDRPEKAHEQVTEMEKELKSMQKKEAAKKKEVQEEITQIREDIAQMRKEIEEAQEQKKWYLEPRVTRDEVTFVSSIEEFNRILTRNELVVAYMYSLPEKDQDIIRKNGVRRRTDRWYTVDQHAASFASVAKEDVYQKAGVEFILVNLDRGGLTRLRDQYNLKAKDAVILFQDAVQYKKEPLRGPFDTHEIRSYVDEYFGSLARERAREKERKREKREKERRKVETREVHHYPRYYNWGWNYPYYRRYYWDYPYYGRRYYGHPGFHFGFSI